MTTYPEVSAVTRMIGSRILWVSLLFYAANAHARVAPTSSLLLRSLLLSVTINLHRAGVPYQHNFLPFYSSSHTSSLYRDLRKPLNRVFQTVSCWSSVSGSERTHQLRAGTHAIRHNQQDVSLVSRKRVGPGGSTSPPRTSLLQHNKDWTSFKIKKPAAAAIGELLHIREDINLRSLLR